MVVKEGYKQTEVGIIPEDWECKLTEAILQNNIVNIKIGPFGSQLKKEYLSEYGKYKVYGQENVYKNDFTIGTRFINKEKYLELRSCELQQGDIVISMMGTIGHCSIVPEKIQAGIMDSHLIRLKINKDCVYPPYIKYCIAESESIQKQIRNLSVGGIMAGLNSNIVKQLFFCIPPLPEQKAIATALSDIDGLIDSLYKLIEKKKKIKQGAMQELLTGKRRLEGFSIEWVEKKLGDIASVTMGQSPDSRYYNTMQKGLPLVQGNADLKNRNTIIRNYSTQITRVAQARDIIMTVRAPVGYIGKATNDCCIGRGVCSIRYENDYLYYYLIYIESNWNKLSAGSTFDSVSSNDVKDLRISIPSTIEEQTAIANILSDMDSEIEKLQAKLDKYKAIKQGMMHELLTGKTRLLEGA